MPQYMVETDVRFRRYVWAENEKDAATVFWNDLHIRDGHIYEEVDVLDQQIFRQAGQEETV